MSKFYKIIVMIIVGLILKGAAPSYAMNDKGTGSTDIPCPPMYPLPSERNFPRTPLACFDTHPQDSCFSGVFSCFESCLKDSCFSSALAYSEIDSQDTRADSVKNSITIRRGLWLISWICDSADDLSIGQRNELANDLKKSQELCHIYGHPAKELFSFVEGELKYSFEHIPSKPTKEGIQTSIKAYLAKLLQTLEKSDNLDAVEMNLFFISVMSGRLVDKPSVTLLSQKLVNANRKEIAAHYLFYIGGGGMLIEELDHKEYLLLAAKYGNERAKNALRRISDQDKVKQRRTQYSFCGTDISLLILKKLPWQN